MPPLVRLQRRLCYTLEATRQRVICPLANNFKNLKITIEELENLWHEFNTGTDQIDLVAIGSPHASLMECRKFADFLDGYYCAETTKTIVTVGRNTLAEMTAEGVTDRLQKAGCE